MLAIRGFSPGAAALLRAARQRCAARRTLQSKGCCIATRSVYGLIWVSMNRRRGKNYRGPRAGLVFRAAKPAYTPEKGRSRRNKTSNQKMRNTKPEPASSISTAGFRPRARRTDQATLANIARRALHNLGSRTNSRRATRRARRPPPWPSRLDQSPTGRGDDGWRPAASPSYWPGSPDAPPSRRRGGRSARRARDGQRRCG